MKTLLYIGMGLSMVYVLMTNPQLAILGAGIGAVTGLVSVLGRRRK